MKITRTIFGARSKTVSKENKNKQTDKVRGRIHTPAPQEPKKEENIQILEMDELYTYIKKNQIKSEFGLLSIGTGFVLLRLKSKTSAGKR